MSYINQPCKDCGSLGPHIFVGNTNTGNGAAEQAPPGPKQVARPRDIPPPESHQGVQTPAPAPERSISPEPVSQGETFRSPRLKKGEGEFPASIRRSNEVLDYALRGEQEEKEGAKRRRPKEADRDERRITRPKYEDLEDEEEKPKKPSPKPLVPTVVSVVLVVLLIIGAIYVANNFDNLTKWLAKPTIPQFLTPFNTPPTNSSPQSNSTSSSTPSITNQSSAVDTPSSSTPTNPSANTSTPSTPTNSSSDIPAQNVTQTPTAISDFQVASISAYGATVSWKTSVPCTGKVIYQTGTNEPLTQELTGDPSKSHSIPLTGLESGKTYAVTVQSQDADGNTAQQDGSFQTLMLTDNTQPQLVGNPSATVTDSTVTISWKTNEKVKSQVKYGLDTGYEFASSQTDGLSTDNNIFIRSLSPDTIYHYQIISTDAAGNTIKLADYQFKTDKTSDAAPYTGSKAPDFTLKDLNGNNVSLSQFRGKKIILNFWASWCTPCKIEMPHFETFWGKYRDAGNVVMMAVAGSESDESAVRSFVSTSNIDFTVCLDSSDDVFNRYNIMSIPKTFFIDENGVIRKVQVGMFTGPGEIEFMLSSL